MQRGVEFDAKALEARFADCWTRRLLLEPGLPERVEDSGKGSPHMDFAAPFVLKMYHLQRWLQE